MTPGNFNWFLHAMLFYHTRLVIDFWCNLATPCDYVSFMYLNQPAQKSNEICITSM
jgi:hypothetical protein